MRWHWSAQNKVDIGLRPRHVFEGTEVNLYPFNKRGTEWLIQNPREFLDAKWNDKDRCLELSDLDSWVLHSVVERLTSAGLKVQFYGRLKGWDGKSSARLHLSPEYLSPELTREKRAQIEGAYVVLKPLVIAAPLITFATCFWWFNLGWILSIMAAILAYPAMLFGVVAPVGRVLGKRAAQRLMEPTGTAGTHSHRPRSVLVSQVMQVVLLAEPLVRAVTLRSVVSIVGTMLIVSVSLLVILQATRRRKRWARDVCAGFAFLGLLSPAVLYISDAPGSVLVTAAVAAVYNFVAVALLFTPRADTWFQRIDIFD
jgi:hypothetical protein